MGFVLETLASVIQQSQAKASRPKIGAIGFAPPPAGSKHRWACVVVDPSDKQFEGSEAFTVYKALSGPKLAIQYLLRDIDLGGLIPFGAIRAIEFVPWRSPAHDLALYFGALAAAESGAVVLENFFKSIAEPNQVYGDIPARGKPKHTFSVSWARIGDFPLWPCVKVSPEIAKIFPEEKWGKTAGQVLIGKYCDEHQCASN